MTRSVPGCIVHSLDHRRHQPSVTQGVSSAGALCRDLASRDGNRKVKFWSVRSSVSCRRDCTATSCGTSYNGDDLCEAAERKVAGHLARLRPKRSEDFGLWWYQ